MHIVMVVCLVPIGSYLFEKLKNSDKYEVCFVWNRTLDKMRGAIPEDLILEDLAQAHTRCDVIVVWCEVICSVV